MWSKLAAIVALPLLIALAPQAHATPANYANFLQTIEMDGIVVDAPQAVREGREVCSLLAPPDGASLWDAAQHLKSTHSDWTNVDALNFANRATQNICPDRDSFEDAS